MKLRILSLAFAPVVLAAAIMAIWGASVAHTQGVDETLPPAADLSLSVEPYSSGTRAWDVSVRVGRVGDHPLAAVRNVRVQWSAERVIPGGQRSTISMVNSRMHSRLRAGYIQGHIDDDSVWTIPSLMPTLSEPTVRIYPPRLGTIPQYTTSIIRVTGEIIGSDPAEPPGFQSNNTVEIWYVGGQNSDGDVGVNITGISDRSPEPGRATTFTMKAENYFHRLQFPYSVSYRSRDFRNELYGVRVKIELSPGLAFAGSQTPPSGTTFNAATGIWDVGTLDDGSADAKSFPVAVNLTGDSLADLPLEKRCLTAKVVRAVPWFELDPWKRQNDAASACLGEGPELSPLTRGEFVLFNVYDCVVATSYPCTDASTIEILDKLGNVDLHHPAEVVERDITRGLGLGGTGNFLKPERIVVQIRDPVGRVYDGKATSLTDENTVSWVTGTTTAHQTDGVRIGNSRAGFNRHIADWDDMVRTVTVSGLNGAAAPGRTRVRIDNSTGFTFYDPNPTHRRAPFTLSSASTRVVKYFLEFTALGTYLVEFAVEATRTDNTVYTASGTYTFHVGPMAELEVRDAGANPAVGADQQAYTIEAVNHGPDEAPAVRVTGLPRGADYGASRGEYDPATGVWTIGKLRVGVGATLTLIAGDADTEIAAEIENTQDYRVVIDGTTHATHYYDHIEDNNTATIAARTGTGIGLGHPEVPGGVTAMEALAANVVMWHPVERVNGHEVTHYEVQRSASPWADPETAHGLVWADLHQQPGLSMQYRVRAVNVFGVRGPWSQIVRTQGMAGSPGLTLVAPTAPRDVNARIVGTDRAVLTWMPPSISPDSGETMQPITGYRVQMSDDGGHWVDPAGLLGGSVTSWTDPNLPPNITRRYRVRAINQIAAGRWSNPTNGIVYNAPIIGDPLPDTGPGSMPPISASRVITSDGDLKLEVWWVGQTWDTQWWTVVEYRERGGPWWYGDELQGDQSRLPRWEGHQSAIRAGQDYDVRACRLTIDQLNDVRVNRADGDWCRGRGTSTARVSGGSASHRAYDGGVPAFFVDWATRRAGAWTRYTIS